MSYNEANNRVGDPRGLCPDCQAGILRKRHLTYFTWLNDELITAPNFPALVCDVCGRREYDPDAIKWLNTLLTSEAGRRTMRRNVPPINTDRLQP